ncbi:MAG: leucine-rich repeat protein [Oscillospiraceae bacterium]|nr:leucine-rich repeat protein [Oscillospiraceae bacterium]
MKRILSFVLSFAMVFTMFAPTAHAVSEVSAASSSTSIYYETESGGRELGSKLYLNVTDTWLDVWVYEDDVAQTVVDWETSKGSFAGDSYDDGCFGFSFEEPEALGDFTLTLYTEEGGEYEIDVVHEGIVAYYTEYGDYWDVYGDKNTCMDAEPICVTIYKPITLKVENNGEPLPFDMSNISSKNKENFKWELNEDGTELTVTPINSGLVDSIAYFAPSNTTEGDGFISFNFAFEVESQGLDFEIEEYLSELDGSAVALSGPSEDEYSEIPLTEFAITADSGNQFGIRLYDENGNVLDCEHAVPLLDILQPAGLYDVYMRDDYYNVVMKEQCAATTGEITFLVVLGNTIEDCRWYKVPFNISQVPGYGGEVVEPEIPDEYVFNGEIWAVNENGLGRNLLVKEHESAFSTPTELQFKFWDEAHDRIDIGLVCPTETTAAEFDFGYDYDQNVLTLSVHDGYPEGLYELSFWIGKQYVTAYLPIGPSSTAGGEEGEGGEVVEPEIPAEFNGSVWAYDDDGYGINLFDYDGVGSFAPGTDIDIIFRDESYNEIDISNISPTESTAAFIDLIYDYDNNGISCTIPHDYPAANYYLNFWVNDVLIEVALPIGEAEVNYDDLLYACYFNETNNYILLEEGRFTKWDDIEFVFLHENGSLIRTEQISVDYSNPNAELFNVAVNYDTRRLEADIPAGVENGSYELNFIYTDDNGTEHPLTEWITVRNLPEMWWDWDFSNGNPTVPVGGTATYDFVIENNLNSNMHTEVFVGTLDDYDNFVAYVAQGGYSISTENSLVTDVTFDANTLYEYYPEVADKGYFYVCVYLCDGGELLLTNLTKFEIKEEDTFCNAWWDYNFEELDPMSVSVNGWAYYSVKPYTHPSDHTVNVLLGREVDGDFVSFGDEGVTVYRENGIIYSVEFNGTAIAKAYPDYANKGSIAVAFIELDENGNTVGYNATDLLLTGKIVYNHPSWDWDFDANGPLTLPVGGEAEYGIINPAVSEGYKGEVITPFPDGNGGYTYDQIIIHNIWYDDVEPNWPMGCSFDYNIIAEQTPEYVEQGWFPVDIVVADENWNHEIISSTKVMIVEENLGPRWNWDFEANGPFTVPAYDTVSYQILDGGSNGDAAVAVWIGYVDENEEFVAVSQVGLKHYFDDNDVLAGVEFNGAEIAEAFPEYAQQGWFHVAIVSTYPDGEVCTNGCDVLFEDGFGGGDEEPVDDPWVSWGTDEDLYVYTYTGVDYPVYCGNFGDTYTAELLFADLDEATGEYVLYDDIVGYILKGRFNRPFEAQMFGGSVMERLPEAYEKGYFYAGFGIYDNNTGELQYVTDWRKVDIRRTEFEDGQIIITDEDGNEYEHSYYSTVVPGFRKLSIRFKYADGSYAHFVRSPQMSSPAILSSVNADDDTIWNLEFSFMDQNFKQYACIIADGIKYHLDFNLVDRSSGESTGDSDCAVYEYDSTAPDGLGQRLDNNDYWNDTDYTNGSIVDLIFVDADGNIIDPSRIIPLGNIDTRMFTVNRYYGDPGRIRMFISREATGNGIYHCPFLVDGKLKTVYMPLDGLDKWNGTVGYLDENGSFVEITDYNVSVPMFGYREIYIKDQNGNIVEDYYTSGSWDNERILSYKTDYGSYVFHSINEYILEYLKNVQFYIGDEYYTFVNFSTTESQVPESYTEFKGQVTGTLDNEDWNERPIEKFQATPGWQEIRIDFYDEYGRYINLNDTYVVPDTSKIPDVFHCSMAVWDPTAPYYRFYPHSADYGVYEIPFYIYTETGVERVIVPINIVEEIIYDDEGGDYPPEEEDYYEIYYDDDDIYIDFFKEVEVTAELLDEITDGRIYDAGFLYIYGEDVTVGDGKNSVIEDFDNLLGIEVEVKEIAAKALSNSPVLEYARAHSVEKIGDKAFADNEELFSVDLYHIVESGKNVFQNCPYLETMGERGFGYYNITIAPRYDSNKGGNVIPENIFSGSDIKEAYLFTVRNLGKDTFADTQLDSVYFHHRFKTIDNAFTDAEIGTVYYQRHDYYWNQFVTVKGDFDYEELVGSHVFEIASGRAGATEDVGYYGENVTWTYYSDYQLVFEGEGAIAEPEINEETWVNENGQEMVEYYNRAPWADFEYYDLVVIGEGITEIGKNAFKGISLNEVSMAETVQTIREGAFTDFWRMQIPVSVTTIEDGTLADPRGEIYYSGTQEEWDDIFEGTLPDNVTVTTDVLVDIPTVTQPEGGKIIIGDPDEGEFFKARLGEKLYITLETEYGYEPVTLEYMGYKLFDGVAYARYATYPYQFGAYFVDTIGAVGGTCGKNVNWTYKNGVLTLNGSGATSNYKAGTAPWEEFKDEITTIVVADGITTLGTYLFSEYSNVAEVVLPDTLTSIGDYNFRGFTSLRGINLPENLKTIGKYTFSGAALESIVLPSKLETIGDSSFTDMAALKGEIVFPASVKYIGAYAFKPGCWDITSYVVEEGNKVYSSVDGMLIKGDEIFRVPFLWFVNDTEGPTDVYIPENVTVVPSGVFDAVITHTGFRFHIHENVTEFASDAIFNSCLIESFVVDENNTEYIYENGFLMTKDGKTIVKAANAALNGNTVLVPEGIETIDNNAFADLYDMCYLKLPSTLKKVGDMAFYSCGNLQRVLIPASLTTIGKEAFVGSYFVNPKEDDDGGLIYGEAFYTGTEAQFKKIKSKIGEEFEYVTDFALISGITVTKADGTVIKDGDTIEMDKIVAPVSETLTVQVEGGFDPITFEQAERRIAIYIDDADIVENDIAFTDEETGITPVTLHAMGNGKTEVSICSITDPSKSVTFTVKVSQRATDAAVEYKGNYTTNNALLLIPDAKKDTVIKPAIKWVNGSAWPAEEYTFAALSKEYDPATDILEECLMELPEGMEIDPATGEITMVKGFDASALSNREFYVYLIADSNPDDDCEMEVGTNVKVAVYDEKAPYVTFTVVNDIFDVADKIVLDPIAGVTECRLFASPYNAVELNTGAYSQYGRYSDMDITATANENFEVVENDDGTITVRLVGNTGSITVTAKALDGSGKSAKMTVTAGTIVEDIIISTELPEVSDNTYVLAAGKNGTLTADLNPAAPTNKSLMWAVNPLYSQYLTVKGGKVTALKACPEPIEVGVYAMDGSGEYDYIYILVKESAAGVDIGRVAVNGVEPLDKTIEETMGDEPIYFHLTATPYAMVEGEKDYDSVYGDVAWSVKGSIAKDVEMTMGDNGVVAFMVKKPGTFSVRAEALDGSKKFKEIKVTVKQLPTEIELTTSGTTAQFKDKETGADIWVFQGDLAKGVKVKPKVAFYAKSKVDSKLSDYTFYIAKWEDGKVEDASIDGAEQVDAKGKVLKQFTFTSHKTSENYTLTAVSKANPELKQSVYIQIRGKDYVPLEEIRIEMPATVALENGVVEVAAGSKVDVVEILNNARVTKLNVNVHKGWYLADTDTETDLIVTKGAKSQIVIPKDAQTGTEYELELRYWNINSPEAYISDSMTLRVVDKLDKKDIKFVLADNKTSEGELLLEGTEIGELGAALNPFAGEFTFRVEADADNATTAYTVISSKAAILDVQPMEDGSYLVTPKAQGKATLKITAMDGSKVAQSVNVTVAAVKAPVTNVVADSKAFTVDLNRSMVVDYSLKSTGGAPTIPDMIWEVSDPSLLEIRDMGIGDSKVEKYDAKKDITYYTTDGSIMLIPQGKAGKVNITGKTTDGSNKSIKLSVTIAKAATAYEVHITVPSNAANGGEQGTVVVPWGKNLKLSATLMPNKAKNATVAYTVEAVEDKYSDNVVLTAEELEALGVTINKSGSLAVKAPAAKLVNPYTGWVKVTAKLNYRDEFGADISDSVYVYIDRPVDKIGLVDENDKKVSSITVNSADIDGQPMVIDVREAYTLTVTNKGFKEETTAESRYGTADNLLWTSNNASLATVDQYGVVTVNEFTKAGSVTITAQAQDGSGAKLAIKITIKK